MFQPQVYGLSSVAVLEEGRIVVRSLAHQDLALNVQSFCGPQELEGLKSEIGAVTIASGVGIVGAVHRTYEGAVETV